MISTKVFPQTEEVIALLNKIDEGQLEYAQNSLESLTRLHPGNPDVKFLDAVLTEDGNSAVKKYEDIYFNSPRSSFADDALYNVYMYFYSIGSYNKADFYFAELKKNFPAYDPSLPAVSEVPDIPSTAGLKKELPFTIQVGAFTNRSNASNLKLKFIEDGYYSDSFAKSIGGTIFNIVVVGKFASESEAEKEIAAIKKKYNIKGRIIPLEQ